MILPRRAPLHGVRHYVTTTTSLASRPVAQYARIAAYQSLVTPVGQLTPRSSSHSPITFPSPLFASSQPLLRSIHTSIPRYQQTQPKEEVRDPPRKEEPAKEAGQGETKDKTEGDKEEGKEGKEESKEESKSDKKDEAAPPPHGDKTPWQVFTQTLRTEFKASKEWNESTKQLSGSVEKFTESDAVRRAREASEAASKGTSQAFRTTGRAIGQSAAWTWDTKVVQGVRAGVNATGRGIERATRPVRETKAFKDISEAVDDGSSSRYGGWTEKEERRLRREARELKEVQSGKRSAEPMVEDPE